MCSRCKNILNFELIFVYIIWITSHLDSAHQGQRPELCEECQYEHVEHQNNDCRDVYEPLPSAEAPARAPHSPPLSLAAQLTTIRVRARVWPTPHSDIGLQILVKIDSSLSVPLEHRM